MSVGAQLRALSRPARVHALLFALVCVALPAASYVDGSGRFAFTMFTDFEEVRCEVHVEDGEGVVRSILPTRIAAAAKGGVAVYLAGTEQFRPGPTSRTARAHLGALADFACSLTPSARRATVTVETRAREGAPVRQFRAGRSCGR